MYILSFSLLQCETQNLIEGSIAIVCCTHSPEGAMYLSSQASRQMSTKQNRIISKHQGRGSATSTPDILVANSKLDIERLSIVNLILRAQVMLCSQGVAIG
jgi:hypothetical protein